MADFNTQALIFGLEGLDLKRTLDKISETRLSRMYNLVRNEDGGITARKGAAALMEIEDGTTEEIHTIGRINTPRLVDFDRFAGAGTKLYCGKFNLELVAEGFSGNPLSLLAYRPPLSSDSWLYVADSEKLIKVKPGTASIPYVSGFRIDEFAKTANGGFDSRDRTRMSCFGFDIADNPGAIPCLALPVGLPPSQTVGEGFRIDEFARVADGNMTARDRTRFSCFGFDIAEATEGDFLTYGTEHRQVIDYFESMSGYGNAQQMWQNNAGTGDPPTNQLSNDRKQGLYSGQFLTDKGSAPAEGFYNYWIRNLTSGATGGGGVGTTRDLLAVAEGFYKDFFTDPGDLGKVQASQQIDFAMFRASSTKSQSFTIQTVDDAPSTGAINSFILKIVFFQSSGGTGTLTPFTRLGGVDQAATAIDTTVPGIYDVDVTALRPGGGSWTIADLSTVEIGLTYTKTGGTGIAVDLLKATIGYNAAPPTPGLSLAVFSDGTQITDDDIVHFWIKLDKPALIQEVRLYFIVSTLFNNTILPGTDETINTDAYVKAFRPSDFTEFFEATSTTIPTAETANENVQTMQDLNKVKDDRGGQIEILLAQRDLANSQSVETAPGRGQWTEFGCIGLPIRRGDFRRIGNNTSVGWGNVVGLCLAVITNTNEDVIINLDDWYLTGGAGLDSSVPGNQRYDYRVINYDPRTGTKSNPTEIQGEAYRLDSLRRAIKIHPSIYGDSNVHQRFFRRGGSLVNNWYYAGENSSDGEIFEDSLSDEEIKDAPTLETDNDQPVTVTSVTGEAIKAQPCYSLWGPVQDLLFLCGEPNQPGYVHWCKPGEPDHWPTNNNIEVCSPTEELIAGFVYKGQSWVFSRKSLYSLLVNLTSAGKVTALPTECTHGIVSNTAFAVGTDAVYFCALDGLYRTGGGAEENITDDILRPLFYGQEKNGYKPINFNFPNSIRLYIFNNDLWFLYKDSDAIWQIMLYSMTMKYWRTYQFNNLQVSSLYYEDSTSGPSSLLIGPSEGPLIFKHTGTNDNGLPIQVSGRTGALDQGIPRNSKLYGDLFIKADTKNTSINITPFLNDETLTLPTVVIASSPGINQYTLDPFNGFNDFGNPDPHIARNISIEFNWETTEDSPVLYHGGPSFILQPDITTKRVTDWDDQGRLTDKYIKGIYLECDTSGLPKTIDIQADGSTQVTITATAAGRRSLEFAFPQFIGRLLRLKPTDANEWILYNYRWIFDEEPAQLTRWETQELDHGIPGWKTPCYAYITIKSSAQVTLLMTTYNQLGVGVSISYTLPSTGGQKTVCFLPFEATKGVLYKYVFTSNLAFWLYREESVVHVQPSVGGDLVATQPFGTDDLDGVRGLHDAGSNANRSGGGAR